MGGCLWSLLALAILIPLYWIIREPVTYLMNVPASMIGTISEITGIANTGAYPQIAMAEALGNPDVLAKAQQAIGEAGAGLFALDFSFLGINLAAIPKWNFWENGFGWESIGLFLLPIVSAAISFLSMQISMKTNQINTNATQDEMSARTNRSMMIMMPLMSLWIGFTVPAGLSVYWIAQYIITIGQELLSGKMLKKDYEAARAAAQERERQEKEEEKRRKEEARLERARRIEEEKRNKSKKKSNKKTEPETPGINKEDSKVGIRAYARGRSYDPNRFGGVTEYVDPNELIQKQTELQSKGKKDKQEVQIASETSETKNNQTASEVAPPVQLEKKEQESPLEEVEIEVDEIEVELPDEETDKKEGI